MSHSNPNMLKPHTFLRNTTPVIYLIFTAEADLIEGAGAWRALLQRPSSLREIEKAGRLGWKSLCSLKYQTILYIHILYPSPTHYWLLCLPPYQLQWTCILSGLVQWVGCKCNKQTDRQNPLRDLPTDSKLPSVKLDEWHSG